MNLEEKIVAKLTEKGYSISTAESCTGGLLAGRLLNVAGASAVYNEGYITYSNEAKERNLKVPRELLDTYGAVSPQVAEKMAEGVANVANAVVGLSTTGIAGPGGGTPDKPVGLIYVCCYMEDLVVVKECRFHGTREENRKAAVEATLQLLWSLLSKKL